VTEDAKRVAGRLRLSNAETKALDSMGHRWWRLAGADEARARRLLYRLGEDNYRNRLMLAWARVGGDADEKPTDAKTTDAKTTDTKTTDTKTWLDLATLPQRWNAPKFPLKAAHFIARGVAEGPALGHVLTLGEDAWLAADFPLDEAALNSIADQAVARLTRDPRS
jgi:poly(A) polymerase